MGHDKKFTPSLDYAEKILQEVRRRLHHPLVLNGVKFQWNNRYRSTAATADSEERLIELSRKVWGCEVNHREEDFRDVILHEIAHLIVGCEAGHNEVWKQWYYSIGGTGRVCHGLVTKP
jgi:predicted SprT family Zn-dependent metalloprotease